MDERADQHTAQGSAPEDPRAAAFDAAPVGLAVVSADGAALAAANRALHRMLGWPDGALVGRALADLRGPARADAGGARTPETPSIEARSIEPQSIETHSIETWRRADGGAVDVRVRRAGPAWAVEAVDPDEAARSAQNREALSAAGLGEWRWDLDGGRLTLSRRAARIVGQPPGRSVAWGAIAAMLTEPERVAGLVTRALAEGGPFDFDTRLDAAGRAVVVRVRGRAVPGPGGAAPAALVGVVQDITARVEADDELLARGQRLRVATAAAELGVFEWHMLDDHAIWENERMYAIFGHAPEDGTIGKDEFLNDILHPEDRAGVRKAISQALREDRILRVGARIRRRSDGAWRTIDMAGRFERDAPDRLPRRLIGVVADVTDRRTAEDRQTLLIRELHHRVKNTLATVQAIVGSTARTATDIDSFYEAFVGRIKSLAHTHSVLTEATWQTASLGDLLANELRPYAEVAGEDAPEGVPEGVRGDGADGRVRLDGPPIDLPSEIAVPIGMAIHELTTNAAKYGALSNRTGRVSVAWALEPGGPAGRLRFSWRETGGPPVAPPRRQGFGSRLLQRVLITQVQAEVATDYAPDGFSLTMLAPMPARDASLNPLA